MKYSFDLFNHLKMLKPFLAHGLYKKKEGNLACSLGCVCDPGLEPKGSGGESWLLYVLTL